MNLFKKKFKETQRNKINFKVGLASIWMFSQLAVLWGLMAC
jgi:hypothetical protein